MTSRRRAPSVDSEQGENDRVSVTWWALLVLLPPAIYCLASWVFRASVHTTIVAIAVFALVWTIALLASPSRRSPRPSNHQQGRE